LRNFENANEFKKKGIKPHQILIVITNESDYETYRRILLTDIEGLEVGEYLLLEGEHCSCYDFDETDWHGTVYTLDELNKLAKAEYNENDVFWKEILSIPQI